MRLVFIGALVCGALSAPVVFAQTVVAPGVAAPGNATAVLNSQPQPLDSLVGMNTDYKIAPNDVIEFEVYGVPDLKKTLRVNASGMISLPLVGSMSVAGMTGQQAEEAITAAYAEKYLQNPQVSVYVKEFTVRRVTIEGAVNRPGIYPVTGDLTLLRLIALAGGGAKYAELSEIMLYRKTPTSELPVQQVFDLEAIRLGKAPDPVVLPDDVVVVNRNAARTTLRDSLFRDIIDSINPFSSIGGN